jgi:hypothetical protein
MKKWMKAVFAGLLALSMTGCGKKANVVTAKDGIAEGGMGDTMSTAWFTFKINSAKLADDYKGAVQAEAGMKLAVVNVTLTNTFDEDIPMFDSDFQIQWGEGDDDYDYPVTLEDVSLWTDGMLEDSYILPAKKSVTGDLVFAVPEGIHDFQLAFLEYYDTEDEDSEEGDVFFITFQAE